MGNLDMVFILKFSVDASNLIWLDSLPSDHAMSTNTRDIPNEHIPTFINSKQLFNFLQPKVFLLTNVRLLSPKHTVNLLLVLKNVMGKKTHDY